MRSPLLMLLLLVALGGCSAVAAPELFTGQGTVRLALDGSAHVEADRMHLESGDPCYSKPAVTTGEQVLVKDDGDKILARGTVTETTTPAKYNIFDKYAMYCVIHFEVTDIPRGEAFYDLELSGSDLGVYTEDELREGVVIE
ncbi:hypothetical protein I6E74_03265 [Salinibacterium sp. SWN139]|uniref:hypothetical protein n=1 Tax=Salinibacterium sp. SWN139 TaxID=2792055 RepID=UPI0018CE6F0F|nr:hypothetical protein [Salinibacterium sp. SWN139]MBH0053185.1 hypothetical protein [Salinibacterium sp. SWN139]